MHSRGTARLDSRGRLVLPADLRRRLGLQPGAQVSISEQSDGSLRITSRLSAARELIRIAGSLDHSVLADLTAEREAQAAAERKDAQRPTPRPRSVGHDE